MRDGAEALRLAAIIRKVDGNHDLGAGALADAILAALTELGYSVVPTSPDAVAQQERMKWRANERADEVFAHLVSICDAFKHAARYSYLDASRAETHVQIRRPDWEEIGRRLDRATAEFVPDGR